LLLLVFWKKRSVGLLFLTTLGILGLFFIFMGGYSLHPELANNYNVLLFNPILFSVVYFQYKKNKKGILYSSVFCFICLFTYVILLINKPYLGLVTPIIITSGLRLAQLILKNKR